MASLNIINYEVAKLHTNSSPKWANRLNSNVGDSVCAAGLSFSMSVDPFNVSFTVVLVTSSQFSSDHDLETSKGIAIIILTAHLPWSHKRGQVILPESHEAQSLMLEFSFTWTCNEYIQHSIANLVCIVRYIANRVVQV